ncbi:S-layer homology domain-containing protein [Veillonella intestinalis]|uniref:S-layer homology domain-containing protein n=2 Tax=Veillonella intestinalis TaxID=2941341 RepID=UPI00203FB854|nr:S-layer homology domain-containing protein [Veillonella intestinalis]
MRNKKVVGTLITVLTMGYSIPYSYAVQETTYVSGENNKVSAYTQTSTVVGYKNNVNSAGLNSDNDVNIVNNATIYGTENSVEFDNEQDISQATAIGYKNKITKFNDTAVGIENELKGNSSVAVGVSNKASIGVSNAILVGTGNTTELFKSVMMGNGNSIKGKLGSSEALAVFGNNNIINNSGAAVVIGHSVNLNSANSGIGIGYRANVSGQSAIALGLDAEAKGFGISIGGWDTKAYDHALAMGHTAHALGYNTIALGTNASADKSSNVAIGNKATAIVVDNAVALGSNSVANRNFILNATVASEASVVNNSVYGFEFAKSADLDEIRNTVKGDLAAISIGNESGSRQIINVAAGTENSDAVNVAQLKAVANSVTNTIVKAGDNITIKPEVKGNTTTYTISADVSKKDVEDLQLQITSNEDRITVLENKPIVDSDTITTVSAGDDSVVVSDDENHNYTIKVSDELQNNVKKNSKDINIVSETVKENITKIDNNSTQIKENIVQIDKNSKGIKENTLKIENNSNRITQNTVNIENNRQAIHNVNARVNHLDSKINKVGAGAAALAGLHPLDFDPDDKWTFSAGYGNYNNADAIAIGSFYRPNEDTMFSIAGSMGNGENMVNASISLKFGQKSTVTNTRVAIAKDLEDLKTIVKAQHKQIESLRQQLNNFTGQQYNTKGVFFEDVPEQHWAYEYVKTLAEKGLLVGYPDGTFKGEKTMTRYEFAAIIYRAMENGAHMDVEMKQLVNEFDYELRELSLDRVRIDRISGADNDRHKIERVRVNSKMNKQENDFRDVYGSSITPVV